MKAKPHGINFTDADWQKLERLAHQMDISVSAAVNQLCAIYFEGNGDFDWQGLKPHGWNRYSEKAVKNDTPDELGG